MQLTAGHTDLLISFLGGWLLRRREEKRKERERERGAAGHLALHAEIRIEIFNHSTTLVKVFLATRYSVKAKLFPLHFTKPRHPPNTQ